MPRLVHMDESRPRANGMLLRIQMIESCVDSVVRLTMILVLCVLFSFCSCQVLSDTL